MSSEYPKMRLATMANSRSLSAFASPSVRLANLPGTPGDVSLRKRKPDTGLPLPSILISYVYLKGFLKHRKQYQVSGWVLDSGAFSALNSGIDIDLNEYIETSKQLLATDPLLEEVFALDVIGDWKASMRNTEKMWEAGVPAIPCFHRGEPESVLTDMAKRFPKIALGGVAMLRGPKKMEWAGQCFARVWPKKIHGFGFGSKEQMMGLPFHTTDATNWEISPSRFGTWQSFGRSNLGIRGSDHPLQTEIDYYLKIQRDVRSRWAKEMKQLEASK